jgi:hypothetical protein
VKDNERNGCQTTQSPTFATVQSPRAASCPAICQSEPLQTRQPRCSLWPLQKTKRVSLRPMPNVTTDRRGERCCVRACSARESSAQVSKSTWHRVDRCERTGEATPERCPRLPTRSLTASRRLSEKNRRARTGSGQSDVRTLRLLAPMRRVKREQRFEAAGFDEPGYEVELAARKAKW